MNLYFTATELARLFWTKPSYIQQAASRGRWARRRNGHQMTYAYQHAERDLGDSAKVRMVKAKAIHRREEEARERAEEERLYLKVYGEIPEWARPDTPQAERGA
jgi:hypothetical protein